MQLYLVDGTYELFRQYFGAPEASAPDGREVGATRALLRTLLSLLGDERTSHVAVAFDHAIESFRNQLFDRGALEALCDELGEGGLMARVPLLPDPVLLQFAIEGRAADSEPPDDLGDVVARPLHHRLDGPSLELGEGHGLLTELGRSRLPLRWLR
jgi:5'-3' exonuclease, N-terminal resolvase-like domain